jgi:hypothetical protein
MGRANCVEETLRSVLQPDAGPEQMQVEVIDDRSTDDLRPLERLVSRLMFD